MSKLVVDDRPASVETIDEILEAFNAEQALSDDVIRYAARLKAAKLKAKEERLKAKR